MLPSWLPWVLVGVGVVLLTVVVTVLLISRRRDVRIDGVERVRAGAELADLKRQLVEVKRLAAAVADDLDRRAERLERLISEADGVLEGQRAGGGIRRGIGGVGPETPVGTGDDLAQRIFTLADQGRTPVQIAQALRQPVGNVELMLALRGGR